MYLGGLVDSELFHFTSQFIQFFPWIGSAVKFRDRKVLHLYGRGDVLIRARNRGRRLIYYSDQRCCVVYGLTCMDFSKKAENRRLKDEMLLSKTLVILPVKHWCKNCNQFIVILTKNCSLRVAINELAKSWIFSDLLVYRTMAREC